jgi:hypothetical protein
MILHWNLPVTKNQLEKISVEKKLIGGKTIVVTRLNRFHDIFKAGKGKHENFTL